jgi:hypothetical protein
VSALPSPPSAPGTGLVDLLDTLVDTGVAVGGDVTLAVAGVDLVRLRLKALLASVETETRLAEGRARDQDAEWLPPPRRRQRPPRPWPDRFDAQPESLERALAQLLLVVADLLRELMERQALRRMHAGSLARHEVERLSEAFEALNRRLEELEQDLASDGDRPMRALKAG